ncbi:MAG: isochorismatase family protein [Candidatus Gastranaerophilaceae bacterium]
MSNTLDRKESLLLIIDVQEKLVRALDKDVVVTRTATLAKAAKILEVPIIATQQYSNGLGQTVEAVKQNFSSDTQIFEKSAFSAVKETGFVEILKSFNKKQIVVCGIETHICVHQTVADLIDEGFDVYIAKDACASRSKYEFKQGIERMQENGAKISCVEIVLFEWLKSSKSPHFREIQALIK